jgi:hypothetical protein
VTLRRAAAVAAACGALLSGCGSAEQLPSIRVDAAQPGASDPEAGRVVLRFVQAARSGDPARMWALLSEPTRRSIGPTRGAFAAGTAPDIAEDFADFRDGRVLVARQLDAVWAVGAVVGRSEDDGSSEPASYAAALRREGGAWRLELDGLVIARLRPGPDDHTGDRPEIRAEAQAGGRPQRVLLWLDGRTGGVGWAGTSPFSAELRGRPDRALASGEHAAVVFASTRETAAALAWTFEVDD